MASLYNSLKHNFLQCLPPLPATLHFSSDCTLATTWVHHCILLTEKCWFQKKWLMSLSIDVFQRYNTYTDLRSLSTHLWCWISQHYDKRPKRKKKKHTCKKIRQMNVTDWERQHGLTNVLPYSIQKKNKFSRYNFGPEFLLIPTATQQHLILNTWSRQHFLFPRQNCFDVSECSLTAWICPPGDISRP